VSNRYASCAVCTVHLVVFVCYHGRLRGKMEHGKQRELRGIHEGVGLVYLLHLIEQDNNVRFPRLFTENHSTHIGQLYVHILRWCVNIGIILYAARIFKYGVNIISFADHSARLYSSLVDIAWIMFSFDGTLKCHCDWISKRNRQHALHRVQQIWVGASCV
jgi:hypothetical protein